VIIARRASHHRKANLLALSSLLALPSLLGAGCVSNVAGRLAHNLSATMLNQQDPEIVRSGAPAYLLLIDALIADQPNDKSLLISGARLYGAYAGGLVSDEQRRRTLSDKALSYARRAFCPDQMPVCKSSKGGFQAFAKAAAQMKDEDVTSLYVFATSWAGWIQARPEDWNAVANLPKVETLLLRVVKRNPRFDRGRAQLYLAVLYSLRPKRLGGHPEKGKAHFDLALKYSGGRDLMVKVEYAQRYARLLFKRKLHDRLLQEVVSVNPKEPGLTLSNVLAQRRARELLDEDYF